MALIANDKQEEENGSGNYDEKQEEEDGGDDFPQTTVKKCAGGQIESAPCTLQR